MWLVSGGKRKQSIEMPTGNATTRLKTELLEVPWDFQLQLHLIVAPSKQKWQPYISGSSLINMMENGS